MNLMGRNFRLERVISSPVRHEIQAHLYAMREDWVLIGVIQLTEGEFERLAALFEFAGIEVKEK